MSDPHGTCFACGVIADGEDEIELRRVRHGELVPAFRTHARCVEPKPVQNRERHRMDFRSEEHTSELQSLMRISYAVFCLKKKKHRKQNKQESITQKQQTNTSKN